MTAPAFPNGLETMIDQPGLTKREYAAIHIAAAIAGRKVSVSMSEVGANAKEAVALADAVLREAGE